MTTKWTDKEQSLIDSAFAAMCELHGKSISVGLMSIYMRSLESFPAAEAVRAIELAMTTSKFFPKPNELLEILRGGKEEHALKAWLILTNTVGRVGTWRSVLFEDPRLCAVVKYFGGWEEIGKWEIEDMDYRRTEFIKAYSSMDNPPPSTKLSGSGSRQAALSSFPDLSSWSIVRKDGEVTHMQRVLANNGHDVLDLPEPTYTRPVLESPPENGNGKDLVPVTTVMKKISGVFKDVPKEGELH